MTSRKALLVALRMLVVLALVGWAVSAQAQTKRGLSGTAQFFIGNGLPIPALPQAGADVKASGIITTTGGAGGTVMIPGSQVTLRLNKYVPGSNVPVLKANPVALQVYTNFVIAVPGPGGDTFAPNGRTGPDVVTWCPGQTATVTGGGNPSCASPYSHPPVYMPTCKVGGACPHPSATASYVVPGLLRYTRTSGMLGGPGSSALGGTFNVAIKAGVMAAGFANSGPGAAPPVAGYQGQTFGNYFQQNNGAGHIYKAGYTAGGSITYIATKLATSVFTNKTTYTIGAPLTEGMLTISVRTGPATMDLEKFTITGTDARTATSGSGQLKLVGGSVGSRFLTGPNANRAIVDVVVPEPAAIAGAAAALLALVGCHQIARRRK